MKTTVQIYLLLLLTLVLAASAFANDGREGHDDYPKPPPTVSAPVQQAPDTDRKDQNLLGGVIFSGLAMTALRDKPNGAIKAIAATVVAAAIIEAAQSGSYNGNNVGYAALGAVVGTVGACSIYFRKGFVGCGMPF